MTEKVKYPVWLDFVIGLMLLWHLLGIFSFIGQMYMRDDMLAALTERERLAFLATPIGYKVAFGGSVFIGFWGSALMLARKILAHKLIIISLVLSIICMYFSFYMMEKTSLYGSHDIIMPGWRTIAGFLMFFFAGRCKDKGWLL